ncbi:hypothetical protein ANN_12907 [Periplaneta americana]|uniref:Transposase Tc1-like domain-containing protein n=1 Tax=Periplaneta americana TaxID=6978 RepID=A0ABQ8TIY1_PERAM|nr:hypothetical protein ANN_12907 [Periplaneta americana]
MAGLCEGDNEPPGSLKVILYYALNYYIYAIHYCTSRCTTVFTPFTTVLRVALLYLRRALLYYALHYYIYAIHYCTTPCTTIFTPFTTVLRVALLYLRRSLLYYALHYCIYAIHYCIYAIHYCTTRCTTVFTPFTSVLRVTLLYLRRALLYYALHYYIYAIRYCTTRCTTVFTLFTTVLRVALLYLRRALLYYALHYYIYAIRYCTARCTTVFTPFTTVLRIALLYLRHSLMYYALHYCIYAVHYCTSLFRLRAAHLPTVAGSQYRVAQAVAGSQYRVAQGMFRLRDNSRNVGACSDEPTTAAVTLYLKLSRAVETRTVLQEIRQVNVIERTVRKRLDECGLKSRSPAKGPELLQQHNVERLRFAHNYVNWNLGEWRRVLSTDESRFSLQMDVKECGEEKEYVFLHTPSFHVSVSKMDQ